MLSGHSHNDFTSLWPSPQYASILWSTFNTRVEPFVRTSYRWALDVLCTKSTDFELREHLSDIEHALVSAIFYISVASLTDEECKNLFQQPRSSLLSHYQAVCEESLLRTNLLCMNDILVMKAIIFYMVRKHFFANHCDS
jgi:hypothetical protein